MFNFDVRKLLNHATLGVVAAFSFNGLQGVR